MVNKRVLTYGLLCAAALLLVAFVGTAAADGPLTPEEELGKALFFDANLSTPPGQSCATCHAPEVGFVGPDSAINAAGAVYPGAVFTRFGNRKPPTAAYGGESPVLTYDDDDGWIGGMFWDGRATGETLGDPLAEQAQGPFLNPLEQDNPNARLVCIKVRDSAYADLFEQVWEEGFLDCVKDVEGTYERIARSIAAYERSAEVNPFSSKFDQFWDNAMGDGLDVTAINVETWEDYKDLGLTDEEVKGLAFFNDENKGKCSLCHVLDTGSAGYPLFTDFTYDNLGVPKNPANPFYTMPRKWNPDGANWVDPGLGGFLKGAGYSEGKYMPEWGKQKVPTLRNVGKGSCEAEPANDDCIVKAYGHNGYFKSLLDITHFYNTRDVDSSWPEPEVSDNVNTDELGDLGLTDEEEAAIVAFMKTLSDGYTP